ncbi:hypothetical protein FKW77_000508 [Venturia effusa]|uniref:Aminoglycoside phosphotransferase domain-containing protein n=1 Tax=Venturia effusa TaxID=50376 RepID=A0A517LJM6_9PEZI|nr:hypothetical protein FKW77_000508 [Venturia effusa]
MSGAVDPEEMTETPQNRDRFVREMEDKPIPRVDSLLQELVVDNTTMTDLEYMSLLDESHDDYMHGSESDSGSDRDPLLVVRRPYPTGLSEGQQDVANCLSSGSTVLYDHEPFEHFQHKVVALCESLWPEKTGKMVAEKIVGGAFNRIVGLTIGVEAPVQSVSEPEVPISGPILRILNKPKQWLARLKRMVVKANGSGPETIQKEAPLQYILRIPRDAQGVNLEHQAGVCDCANELSSSWAAPTTVRIDTSCNNALGLPYIIQTRIPGTNCDDLWDELNHQQKMSLGTQVGKVFCDMSRHSYPVPGTINAPFSGTDTRNIGIVEHEYQRTVVADGISEQVTENQQTPATRGKTALGILRSRFQKWKICNADPEYPDIETTPYTRLARIADEQQRDDRNWCPEYRFYVAHNDIHPRNIMARIINDHKVEVTGVVDWDCATIAPAVVAFQPPWWLWKHDQYYADLVGGSLGIIEPDRYAALTTEEKQIRAAFEARAGFEVTRHTSDPNSHLARRLWNWSSHGVPYSMFELAWEVVEKKEASWPDSDSGSDSDKGDFGDDDLEFGYDESSEINS